MRKHHFFSISLLVGLSAGGAAPALTPVDKAVQAYARGDLVAARTAFERLSREGSAVADYNLAVMRLNGQIEDTPDGESIRLLERAASRGFVTAMVAMAQLHERGLAGRARDLPAAYAWYLRAAQAGSPEAQTEVATAHYLGRGAPRDSAAAAHWYLEAAKRGDVGAQYLVASMLEQGDGVPRDLRLARYWYEVAARNGDVAAPGKVKEIDARMSDHPD